MGAKIREALKLRFDKRLRLEPMAEMLRVVWEVLSRIDNHMRWVYHRRQDRRWTKISSLRVEMGNPGIRSCIIEYSIFESHNRGEGKRRRYGYFMFISAPN
jgi:hypothetical protein